jgi:hypothetical protein
MAGPTYRGLRLDRSTAEFHRAVDRLRWDTDPRRTEPTSTTPTPPVRRGLDQAATPQPPPTLELTT